MANTAMKPLDVYAVDEKMNRCTGPIPYSSLRWVRRYREPGEFEMVVPADVYDPSWAYICCDDRPETGIVQKTAWSDDEHGYAGLESVTVAGFFLESLLDRITFLVEAPEEEKVYVPAPRRPAAVKGPKVYTDTVGGTYIEVGKNEVVSLETGRHSTANGLTETPYDEEVATNGENPAYSFYDGPGGDIVRVDWRGREQRVTPEFSHGGSAWYRDPDTGRIKRAQAVAEKKADAYWISKKRWDALADDEYGSYYTQTVKGPWQRTEATMPNAEGDTVELAMRYARAMMGDWLKYEEPRIKGVTKQLDPSLQPLGKLLYSTLGEVGASLRLEYEFEANAFVLSFYRGADRTQGQSGNPWAVFSDTWGTLSGCEAWRDASNYRNTCYVLYDYEEPLAYDAGGWPAAQPLDDGARYGVPTAHRRGYETARTGAADEPAAETFLDMRGEKPSCDREWKHDAVTLPPKESADYAKALESARKQFAPPADAADLKAVYTAYRRGLKDAGMRLLAEEHAVERGFEAGAIDPRGYLDGWDLGDLVDVASSALGESRAGRVEEVEETYDESGCDVDFTVGDAAPKDTEVRNGAS